MNRNPRRVAALMLTSALVACDVDDPTLVGPEELPENLGTEIAGSLGVTDRSFLHWSPDGSTVWFEVGSPASLHRVDIATGEVTLVDGPRGDYIDLAFAPDGEGIFFSADLVNGARTTYFLRSGSGPAVLTDRAPGTLVTTPADGVVVLPAPTGTTVAYIVRPDSLFLYDTETREHRYLANDCVRAVVFSPDLESILCRGGTGSGPFQRIRIEDGSVEAIDLLPREASILKVIRWEDDAILTLYQTATRFRVRDVVDGTTTTIWAPGFSRSFRVMDFIYYAWSRDGSRFAFWLHECLRINRVGECSYGQSLLHAVDMAENTGGQVVVAKGTRGGEQVAISPDRTLIAYVFDGRIWLQTIQ